MRNELACGVLALWWTAVPRAAGDAPTPPLRAGAAETAADETAAGFRPLFDGRSTKGWRIFNGAAAPDKGWSVADGVLKVEAGATAGDLVTDALFESFDLRLQFRLTAGANSGVKYLVDDAMAPTGGHGIGFEYQLIDDDVHPDAKAGIAGNRTCGALYDLIGPRPHPAPSIGGWNDLRLVVAGGRIEHWLNGIQLLAFDREGDALRALIATSKYKAMPGFGTPRRGRILLQDHGQEVAFRNIRIRELAAPSS
jgi:hypothetical protein